MKNTNYSILVATNHLNSIGGTEIYTYYFIKELKRIGHDIEYFTLKKGIVSEKIEEELGVKEMRKTKYDLILANHNSTIEQIWKLGPIIQTCHGIFPYLEQPSVYADCFVAISQEVQQHLSQKGLPSFIIPNGINCEIFRPINPVNKTLTKVLSLCQSEVANTKIKNACKELNISFVSYQDFGKKLWDIQKEINKVDLVIGLGRSAYDAMACGRPVIIYDERNYMGPMGDGYISEGLTESFSMNCSGRFFKKEFTTNDFINEFKKYKAEDGDRLRRFVTNYLDLALTTEKYLDIIKSLSNKAKVIISIKTIYIKHQVHL